MKNLINMTTSDERPTFIDAASVTAIRIHPDRQEMEIFNQKGLLYNLDIKSWNIDAGDLLKKLADAGNPLAALPDRHDGKERPCFISPAAVTFATLSAVTDDGVQGIIVGVRGVGQKESSGVTPAEVTALLDAVRAAGTQLLEFKPETAYARWSYPGALYIDPASVRGIREDASQVNVSFAGSGTLDVQTGTPSKSRVREEEIIGALWKQRKKEGTSLNAVAQEARDLAKAEADAARVDFAAILAAANGTLTQVTGTARAIYVSPEDFVAVRFYTDTREDVELKYSMMLERQQSASNPYPDSLRVSFNTAAEREESFRALVSRTHPLLKKARPLKS